MQLRRGTHAHQKKDSERMYEFIKTNTLRDRIAFRFIRLGFKIAMKNRTEKNFFQYNLLGDVYTFQSRLYSLTKTDEPKERGGEK